MPCVIWCDRAPFQVAEDIDAVLDRLTANVGSVHAPQTLTWLRISCTDGRRASLRTGAITSVVATPE